MERGTGTSKTVKKPRLSSLGTRDDEYLKSRDLPPTAHQPVASPGILTRAAKVSPGCEGFSSLWLSSPSVLVGKSVGAMN